MGRRFVRFLLLAICYHGYQAVPVVETTTDGKPTPTTGMSDKANGLSVRFGSYETNNGGNLLFPGIATRTFGGSESSSSSSSSINRGDYTARPANPENQRLNSQRCACCNNGGVKRPCGHVPQTGGAYIPERNYPPPPPPFDGQNPYYPSFEGGTFPGFDGGLGSPSESKYPSSSGSKPIFGGNYFGVQQSNPPYPGGVVHPYLGGYSGHLSHHGGSSSASSSSASSFSKNPGYQGVPDQGFPGGYDRPFAAGFPGSSSVSQSSSSSKDGGGGSFSSSMSSSGSVSGGRVVPIRPIPLPEVPPEFSLPDGMCRSSGC